MSSDTPAITAAATVRHRDRYAADAAPGGPHLWRRAIVTVAVAAAWAASVRAAERQTVPLYLTGKGQSGIWRIDPATGDRTVTDLDQWPVVMTVNQATVLPDGALLFEGTNALGRRNLLRWAPSSGAVTGVSGLVDATSDEPRGGGPGLEPGSTAMLAPPGGDLLFLRTGAGPIAVNLATGDRRVVSQSVEPPVGGGFSLTAPLDLVLESPAAILVTDRFEGVVRVALADGERSLAHPGTAFVEPPYRIDRLADGRLVHAHGLDSSNALYVFDPAAGVDTPLSGSGWGEGPPFGSIVDLVLAPDGTIYVFDGVPPTVLAVDPESGDRRVVSGGAEGRGTGIELPTVLDAPRFATFSPGDRARGPRPLRRRLPRGSQ